MNGADALDLYFEVDEDRGGAVASHPLKENGWSRSCISWVADGHVMVWLRLVAPAQAERFKLPTPTSKSMWTLLCGGAMWKGSVSFSSASSRGLPGNKLLGAAGFPLPPHALR